MARKIKFTETHQMQKKETITDYLATYNDYLVINESFSTTAG